MSTRTGISAVMFKIFIICFRPYTAVDPLFSGKSSHPNRCHKWTGERSCQSQTKFVHLCGWTVCTQILKYTSLYHMTWLCNIQILIFHSLRAELSLVCPLEKTCPVSPQEHMWEHIRDEILCRIHCKCLCAVNKDTWSQQRICVTSCLFVVHPLACTLPRSWVVMNVTVRGISCYVVHGWKANSGESHLALLWYTPRCSWSVIDQTWVSWVWFGHVMAEFD